MVFLSRRAVAFSLRSSCRLVLSLALLGTVSGLTFGAPPAPSASAKPASPSIRETLLEERLATGEIGPALDAASDIEDLTTRVSEMQRISASQRALGDFRGASETAHRIPERTAQAAEFGALARDRGQHGGGTMADFTELIELITNTIEPDTWDEVGGGGSVREFNTGVYVDPTGHMRQRTKADDTGTLDGLARRARPADLDDDLARQSPLRIISLRRLEKAVAGRLAAKRPLPETLRRMAGLTRIEYLFVDPEDHDVRIAGPAEGWRYDESSRPLGLESGRPPLALDDFVVVLRAFAPGSDALFGCSINTRDANLKAVKEFVEASNSAGPLRPRDVAPWVRELQTRLGLQDVVVHGVPQNTHVASVLVEADYKMKLVGVDKYDAGPGIPSYFDLLRKSGNARGAPLEALRWWLTIHYDGIRHSADKRTFALEGSSVLVQSENQFVNAQGKHVPTGVAEPLNRQFAENFTRNYADVAKRDSVFAELQNIFDMALVAALCRQEDLFGSAGWTLGVFAPQGAYRPAELPTPKVVESVVNHRVYGGKDIVVQVAGGVQADIAALAREARPADGSRQVFENRRRPEIPEGRWWWDAAK